VRLWLGIAFAARAPL